MQRNAEITLQHLTSWPLIRLIQKDNACRQEIRRLTQQLCSMINPSALHLLKQELISAVDPVDANTNQPIINLLALARARITANNNILSFTKTKIDCFLKSLQLYLLNERAYKKLGIAYQDTIHTGRPKSEFETYFNRENRFLNVRKIREIDSFSLVFVSGMSPNPYGHVLLKLGDIGYIHIYDLYSKPLFIPHYAFGKFLQQSGQMLLGIQQIHVPDIEAAKLKLRKLSQSKWLWLMYKNNCEDFAEAVVRAGGASCAQLAPEHIADYYGHTAYPARRFDALSLDNFIQTESNDTIVKRKKNTHGQYKEELRHRAKEHGMNSEQAKKYVHYRLAEGLTHASAQYKADPSLAHFLVQHKVVIQAVSVLHPVFFFLLTPVLLGLEVPAIYRHLKKQSCSFFSRTEKNSTPSATSVSASELAEAASFRM